MKKREDLVGKQPQPSDQRNPKLNEQTSKPHLQVVYFILFKPQHSFDWQSSHFVEEKTKAQWS